MVHITTKRLELREYVPDDLDALVAYQTDPRTREFYGPDEGLRGQIPDLLRTFLAWAAEEPRRNWQLAVVLRQEPRRLIGSCGLRQAGMHARRADLGLDLDPTVWGRGYGIESATALVDFGFRDLGLDCIEGLTVSANTRVASLLARLGFRFVGSRQGPEWMTDRGWTHHEWELSEEDWTAVGQSSKLCT